MTSPSVNPNKQLIEAYLDEIDSLLESDFPYDHPRIIELERRIDELMEENYA